MKKKMREIEGYVQRVGRMRLPSPVYGAFREAVLGPAFTPGNRRRGKRANPVHGVSRCSASATERNMAQGETARSPVNRALSGAMALVNPA
jgi:hypothetical protein